MTRQTARTFLICFLAAAVCPAQQETAAKPDAEWTDDTFADFRVPPPKTPGTRRNCFVL
jgi:hypothetical protein